MEYGCPDLLKYFTWKVNNDLLPTKEKLFQKHVTSDSLCSICTRLSETIFHILWSCPSSMAVWQEGSRGLQKLSLEEGDGREFVHQLWLKLSKEELVEALNIAQPIWMRRNNYIFNNQFSPPTMVTLQAKEMIEGFRSANVQARRLEVVDNHVELKWLKPPLDWLKCNWDAAVDKKRKMMGVAIVVRDALGLVVYAAIRSIPFITDPMVVEADESQILYIWTP
jgi:hypothetical protein